MGYLKTMRKTPITRLAVMALLLAVFVGWSAQAFSFVMTGSCVGSMASMDMSSMTMSPMGMDDDPNGPTPCEGVALKCVNSLGCVFHVGLPQAKTGVITHVPTSSKFAAFNSDRTGISLQPELSPPISLV